MNQTFFLGVVENRDDPLFLGRCRIRVIGIHNPDKTELPTEGLPWAIPVQPITSAAMSGIGHAPVGPVEGTWCLVIFTDPESMQQPMFIGTIGGIPNQENVYEEVGALNDKPAPAAAEPDYSNPATGESDKQYYDSNGNPVPNGQEGTYYDANGNPVPETTKKPNVLDKPDSPTSSTTLPKGGTATPQPTPPPATQTASIQPGALGSLSTDQVKKLTLTIREAESNNDYRIINSIGFTGAYQFGMAALEDLGYVRTGSWAKWKNNKRLDQDVWSGKEGCTNLEAFRSNKAAQDSAFQQWLPLLYKRMVRARQVTDRTPPEKLAGLLWVAHNMGTGKGGVRDFLKGGGKADGYGTTPAKVYGKGYRVINPTGPIEYPNGQTIDLPPAKPNKNLGESGAGVSNPVSSDTVVTPGGMTYQSAPSPEARAKGDPTKMGFVDPNLKYPLKDYINEPDTHRLARHQKVERTAIGEKQENRERHGSFANSGATWEQPATPYNAQYPFNHVYATESGHIMEFDDTPNAERIHIYHKNGSFIEIGPNGCRVDRITGSRYSIVEDDDYLMINGTGAICVDGDFSIDVKKSLQIDVRGDAQLNVEGSVYQNVVNDVHLRCKNYNVYASDNINFVSGKQTNHRAIGEMSIKSDKTTHLDSATGTHVKSSQTLNLESGTTTNHKAVGKYTVDSNSLSIRGASGNGLTVESDVQIRGTGSSICMSGGDVGIRSASGLYLDAGNGVIQAMQGKAGTARDPAAASGATSAIAATEAKPLQGFNPTVEHYPVSNFITTRDIENEPDGGIVAENPSSVGVNSPNQGSSNVMNTPSQPGTPTASSVTPGSIKQAEITGKPGQIEMPISASTRLSTNFTLGSLNSSNSRLSAIYNPSFGGQSGYTREELVLNLQGLAINILEPLKEKYPDLIINSCLRKNIGNSGSQHMCGQAADLSLGRYAKLRTPGGVTQKEIREFYAKTANEWIQLLPSWCQLILEYNVSDTVNTSCWIHVSYVLPYVSSANKPGRFKTNPKQVLTIKTTSSSGKSKGVSKPGIDPYF